jgi:hypothetical protein
MDPKAGQEKKVPMIIYVDPEVETTFTIKPFAKGLASKAAQPPSGMPDGTSVSASGTNLGGSPDVDADADFT